MSGGNLVIRPLTAKLTRDTETFGKMDPYVKINMGQQFKRTAVCQDGGKNPGWKEDINLRWSGEDIIAIEVWDKDQASKDDLIGSGSIAFATIQKKGDLNEWVNLTYKGKSAGQILLDIKYYPDGGAKPKDVGNPFAQPTTMMYGGQPTYGQPTYVQPTTFVQTQPVYQQPTYQQPTYQQPTYQQPTYVQQSFPQQQTFPQQTYQQPTYQQPTYQQPTYQQQSFPQQTYPQQQSFPQQQTYVQQGYPQQQQQQPSTYITVQTQPGFQQQPGYGHHH